MPSPKPPVLCRAHLWCERCRADTPEGQGVRDRFLARPLDGLDLGPRFACPFGRGEVGAFVPWPESKGLGDTVKRVTDFLGIEQCEPCKERQERWNEAVPYGDLTTQGQ